MPPACVGRDEVDLRRWVQLFHRLICKSDMNTNFKTIDYLGISGIIYADYDFDDFGEPYLAMQIVGGDKPGTDFVTFDGRFAEWIAEQIWGWQTVYWARDERRPLMAGNAA